MITKKDYIQFAEILKENNADKTLIEDFCNYFQSDNPLFNREKFIQASTNEE